MKSRQVIFKPEDCASVCQTVSPTEWPYPQGHPNPRANFTERLHEKKKREPGYDELLLWTEWNISVRMLCVARLGLARRVDSLVNVYMSKSWLAPQGHPILPTEWPYPQGHPTPRDRFAVSHVNGRRWFISSCRKTWLAPGWLGFFLRIVDL